MKLTGSFLLALLPPALFSHTASGQANPSAPELTFLYTAYVECASALPGNGAGPSGTRSIIPIVGGNFTGPRVSGTISNLGADWGLTDASGTFSSDTRYNLVTSDKANIYIRTSGPTQASGKIYLRIVFETAASKYTWMNSVVAVGVLSFAGSNGSNMVLRIDSWQMA